MKNAGKNRGGLFRKLVLYITLIISFLMLFTTVLTSGIINRSLRTLAVEKYQQNGSILTQQMDERLQNLESATEEFIFSDPVQRTLESEPITPRERDSVQQMWYRFSSSTVRNGLYIDSGDRRYMKAGHPGNTPLNMDALKQSELYGQLEKSYAKAQWAITEDPVFGTGGKSLFMIRRVRKIDRPSSSGVLILQMTDSFMGEIFQSAPSESGVSYAVLDSSGQLYHVFGAELPSGFSLNQYMAESAGSGLPYLDRGRCIIFSHQSTAAGLRLASVVPYSVIFRTTETVQRSLLLTTILFLCAAFIATLVFSARFTRPISEIHHTLQGIGENNLSARMNLDTGTELDDIGQAYNDMMDRIHRLIDDVAQKEHELRKNELESLLYQINPHFMYNTLDNMFMLARLDGDERMMTLIQSLSSMLRISLSKGSNTVTVEKELEHVRSYLNIQKIRFGDLFDLEISCDPEVSQCEIIKLILQPVAENSVKYGFADMRSGGLIRIHARKEGDSVLFEVYNNGTSISPENAEKLNAMRHMDLHGMQQVFTGSEGGFGLRNVISRLVLLYEDHFDIRYSPVPEGGTRCVIKLPCRWDFPG